MTDRSSNKRPRDVNVLAAAIVTEATGAGAALDDGKNPAAVALGRLVGKKGGKARVDTLSPERHREIARKAAQTQWSGHSTRPWLARSCRQWPES